MKCLKNKCIFLLSLKKAKYVVVKVLIEVKNILPIFNI
jgi:hypothetical protein